jgi:hypothetical protein
MIRQVALVCALILPAAAAAQSPVPTGQTVVYFSIFGPPGSELQRFYGEIFGWKIAANGDLAANVMSPLPASVGNSEVAETIVYVGVEDISATLERVTANGGTIRYPRFEVPGRVILGLFKDPAGNSVGLVEMADGKVKIPPFPVQVPTQ